MRVLLVRPACNERFGLGPFFRVEPLGMEYIAAALLAHGHEVQLADLRFTAPLETLLRRFRPRMVGVANMHAVDIPAAGELVRAVKRHDGGIFTLVGGHSAASYPRPHLCRDVDAICVDDGEATVPELADALEAHRPLTEVRGLLLRAGNGAKGQADRGSQQVVFEPSATREAPISLDETPLPARHLVERYQRHYLVVQKNPLYGVETARGCPFRCSFCSIWRLMSRTFRCRGIDAVCRDMASTGANVFIVDDLFWHPRARSAELGRELVRRGHRKDWVLVQTRLDTVARGAEQLEAWLPVARDFDIFFGFEAPTDRQLQHLDKDFDVKLVEEGVRVAREHRYGITGNFVVDPDWDEHDFQAMWDLVARLQLTRVGYTILTPLPGTPMWDEMAHRIVEHDFSKYDMHHILYEPRLGRRRFFELFTQSWKRNVLSPTFSLTSWLRWIRQVRWSQLLLLARTIYQTQRIVRVDAYLKEAFPLDAALPLQFPAAPGVPDSAARVEASGSCPSCGADLEHG